MTDKEPIDQIVCFLNDIDILKMSIYFFNFLHMLFICVTTRLSS